MAKGCPSGPNHRLVRTGTLQMAKPASLRVNYRATGRNRPAHDVLAAMGFQDAEEGMFLKEASALECEFIQCQWTASSPGVAA